MSSTNKATGVSPGKPITESKPADSPMKERIKCKKESSVFSTGQSKTAASKSPTCKRSGVRLISILYSSSDTTFVHAFRSLDTMALKETVPSESQSGTCICVLGPRGIRCRAPCRDDGTELGVYCGRCGPTYCECACYRCDPHSSDTESD